MSGVVVVITACRGRESNLDLVLGFLRRAAGAQMPVVVVVDGPALNRSLNDAIFVQCEKHHPGMEQPRNIGVRHARREFPDATHVWFLDSDVVPDLEAPGAVDSATSGPAKDAIAVAPYDWLPENWRPVGPDDDGWLRLARAFRGSFPERMGGGGMIDTRWPMFDGDPGPHYGDLSKGLGCYSGNLVWPIAEFERIGGFWNELHHGRCEDGELGLRAVAMGVGIYLVPAMRGYHLWHPENMALKLSRNERDVPMLNARHPWMQGHGVFMVDRDGKAFDVRCHCGAVVPTSGWWAHEASHR